jgi:predicted esterase YcpF (UPF0227 family)
LVNQDEQLPLCPATAFAHWTAHNFPDATRIHARTGQLLDLPRITLLHGELGGRPRLLGPHLHMSKITHLLYLHGFRSSPLSAKARFLSTWFAQHHPNAVWCCPQLPASPKASAELMTTVVKDWPHEHMLVMGSSLGGFYATWLAGHKRCKALLLNPAVHPARDLARYIGEHPVWQQPEDRIFFDPSYIDELLPLYVGQGLAWLSASPPVAPTPDAQDTLAVIATGDEVLDWREMSQRYAHAKQHIIQGSDHGLSEFELEWPKLTHSFQFI